MIHQLKEEFILIAKQIAAENHSLNEWALIESPDQFQTLSYSGGFDALEMEFCFSYYNTSDNEYWFQLSLDEIINIASGLKSDVTVREAD